MLYHYLRDPQSGVDVEQIVCDLREPLDLNRFRQAWNQVVMRHQPLRTRFRWGGLSEPVQEVLRYTDAFEPRVLDWRGRSAEDRERAFRDLLTTDRHEGFDLATAPAMRLTVVRIGETEWRCVWSFPHILLDGRSFPVVLCEVFDLYDANGSEYRLAPAPQYSGFIRWLGQRDRSGEEAFWRRLLKGLSGPTPLPGGEAAAARTEVGRGECAIRLAAAQTGAVSDFAKALGVTSNTLIQGAWALLLSRYTGDDDVVFGAARACRGGTVAGAENTVGVFINTVPVRVSCQPDARVSDWLGAIRRQQLDVRPFEHTPLTDIQRWSGFPAGQPLFHSIIVFDHGSLDGQVHARRPAWTHRHFALHERTPFPLTLYAYAGDQLELKLAYDLGRFSDSTASQLLVRLVTLLDALSSDPERPVGAIRVLGERERRQQLVEWNATERQVDLTQCVHRLVEAQVRRSPGAPAIADNRVTLTYAELDARANRLAHRLLALGATPDCRVGICVDRSVDLVVGVLGVLKAGAAFVPLDPDYPPERLRYMAEDAGLVALVTVDHAARDLGPAVPIVNLTREAEALRRLPGEAPQVQVNPDNLAYVIYTSGSTGRPKGVMVEHRNVVNFFAAMDDRVPGPLPGTWLAVTSLSFDISVLELLWPLTRGCKVVVAAGVGDAGKSEVGDGDGPAFSLFYFASGEGGSGEDKYRLLLEGARFADERGFHAVWTPERHFHAFGGLYPNPSVAGAALASITRRVGIRAGSVVLPLHHPVRIAEEWALVDNLSRGRVGVSFASGWQPNDFVLAPDKYGERKRVMLEGIETVRRLWRGEAVAFPGPDGSPVPVRVLPRPIQPELPVWITTAGSPDTYRAAGEAGAYVLTHLLGQTVEDVAKMISVYREAWKDAGHPGEGHVTLMLHTFVGTDEAAVRETVREPMKAYLRSAVSLIKGFAGAWTAYRRGAGRVRATGDEFENLSPEDLESLLDFAFERYFETSGLFGTPERCLELVGKLRRAGVDEIACLIDFGVPTDQVLPQLEELDRVRRDAQRVHRGGSRSLAAVMAEHGVTHLQCTPSAARMLLADPETRGALGTLRAMLVGGEPLPGSLANELRAVVKGPVLNMYGPTETTIWSSTYDVGQEHGTVPIGRPIANTRFYVLDRHGQPVPVGVPGELYIGGAGVVRGYLGRPDLTAERFLADPFVAGQCVYRTGDVVRFRADGVAEFLGRADHQVKIRGHRIELGEIEAVVGLHPEVRQVVVHPWQRSEEDLVLVAYVVARDGKRPTEDALRAHARARLPEAMVPGRVVLLDQLPLTPNGKVDRKALPVPTDGAPQGLKPQAEEPATALEQLVVEVWQSVLGVQQVGRSDHFFELGGNSLTTIQVAVRIRDALGIELPLRAIFDAPTVSALAVDLERRLLEGAEPDALTKLLGELEGVRGQRRMEIVNE
jgi:natural product biosynthesis luciferase-like monooxygenase protein